METFRGAKSDPLTNLQSRTRFGRPEWRSVYSDLKSSVIRPNSTYLYGREARLKTNIATFFCGPPALARSIQEAIKEVGNDAEVKFRWEYFNAIHLWQLKYIYTQLF